MHAESASPGPTGVRSTEPKNGSLHPQTVLEPNSQAHPGTVFSMKALWLTCLVQPWKPERQDSKPPPPAISVALQTYQNSPGLTSLICKLGVFHDNNSISLMSLI